MSEDTSDTAQKSSNSEAKRPEWMSSISGIVNPEDYLLGRKIDKTFELHQQEKADRAKELRANLIATDKLRLRADPILDLERRKYELKLEIVSNPIKLKQFRDYLLAKEREAANVGCDSHETKDKKTSSSRSVHRRHYHSKHKHSRLNKDRRISSSSESYSSPSTSSSSSSSSTSSTSSTSPSSSRDSSQYRHRRDSKKIRSKHKSRGSESRRKDRGRHHKSRPYQRHDESKSTSSKDSRRRTSSRNRKRRSRSRSRSPHKSRAYHHNDKRRET